MRMRPLLFAVLVLSAAPVFADEDMDVDNDSSSAKASPDRGGLSEDIVDKLSPEQLADVLKARAHKDDTPAVSWIAPLAFFIFALGAVAFGCVAWVKNQREKQLTLRAAVEKGAVPAGLFERPKNVDLRRGILFIATGAGIGLALLIASPEKVYAAVAALPLALGGGYLASWRWTGRGELPKTALESRMSE